MAVQNRIRKTANGHPTKEKYVECTGCGDWRWVQYLSQATHCTNCKQSVNLRYKPVLLTRPLTKPEASMIAKFLKTKGPSTVCATESAEFKGKPIDYGVSNCSSGLKL